MGTKTYRTKDDREVIKYGNSQAVTIDLGQLEDAGIPVGTEVAVTPLRHETGLKVHPPEDDAVYHRNQIRDVIEMGNSQGLTIERSDLRDANMPVGTEIEVIDLGDEPGLKLVPHSN